MVIILRPTRYYTVIFVRCARAASFDPATNETAGHVNLRARPKGYRACEQDRELERTMVWNEGRARRCVILCNAKHRFR